MHHPQQQRRRLRLSFLPWLVWLCLLQVGAAAQTPSQQQHPLHGSPDPDDGRIETRLYLPHVQRSPVRVLISAAHIDSALSGEGDEAIQIWNLGAAEVDLDGWQINGSGRSARFPSGMVLAPGEQLWCAKDAALFVQTFGFSPRCEWSTSSSSVPDLVGSAPALTNGRGYLQLQTPAGVVADALLYGDAINTISGWSGAAAQIYAAGDLPSEGQVWRRKFDPATNRPLDSDSAIDWSGDRADLLWGRQVFFPGWDLWVHTGKPARPLRQEAAVTVAVAPDGLYLPLAKQIQSAHHSIDLSLYTFEHPQLALLLAEAAARGVVVRLHLEGSPAGGITDLQRWCLAQMATAGVQIALMDRADHAPPGFRPRYRFLHAKYGVVDGRSGFVGTENWTYDSAPTNVDAQMPIGRRGVYLFTDAPVVVADLSAIFAVDWQPRALLDLRPFDPVADAPPPAWMPPEPLTPTLVAAFAQPLTVHGTVQVAVSAAPDQAPRPDALLLDLLRRTGAGDSVQWMQLYEHRHWGDRAGHPIADPNPRLQALIDAARRGAGVRVLLDAYFDDADDLRSNQRTADYLRTIAAVEGLDLEVRLLNPTGRGIHAKMILLHIGDEHWSIVGSLNGGEVSHKLNREVTLFVEQADVHAYLRQLFEHDWTVRNDW